MKKSDLSHAIFDAISLYCVEQKIYDSIKLLTQERLEPLQGEIEKLLAEIDVEIKGDE